jgi:hypothetical protein
MPNYGDEYPAPWSVHSDSIISVVIENGVTGIGRLAFTHHRQITTISIPNSVTTIGAGAFWSCSRLSSIIIPNGVSKIDVVTFSDCTSLKSLTLPNSIRSIEFEAFRYCGLTSITIPHSVDTIVQGAFRGCHYLQTVNYNAGNCSAVLGGDSWPVFPNNLATLIIGNVVQKIPDNIFYGCTGITSITTHAISPPAVGLNAFSQVPANVPVIVPCGTKQNYKNNTGWSYFTNFIGLEPDEICMISVDENNHNEIIWKKQNTVSSYNIYREGIQGGQYDLVANIAYNESNRWVDMESNARVRSYRYKIAGIGGGGECDGVLSPAHKTMHLTINAGVGNSWNLIWTAYEGTEYSTYNIYRSSGDSIGDLQFIGTMPSGNTSFSDFSAPQGYVYYMVEILLNETCNVGKAGSSIKSNIATNNPHVAVNENVAIPNISVYPNPTTGRLRIESGGLKISDVEIFDVYGRKVLSPMSQPSPETVLNISHLTAGLYFL